MLRGCVVGVVRVGGGDAKGGLGELREGKVEKLLL